ncbi:PREDICTED: NAC domain-containing protein 78-like [Fragaria vesca subsp. vesca]|uniref:NAC domain-containing protein 78-like n=1 Tax=Fragaria vesca subsp. vesca TaxID=101020 RepID=UPI0002C2E69B|nr:PREDICTED: NAC domain-containing protein 78-like [Fragaria vesca subsp. vesca]XP_011458487.1 PREDICTED: NAC domain-containing protein 78-like [Fragaria vesca subsp. vesca]
MGKSSLPPGFRFNPTDVELVQYYLKRKIMGKKLHVKVVAEVDIYKWAPWDLPDKSCWRSGDLKWYFFCPREKKYASGGRVNRATDCGYWKTTGKDRSVLYNSEVVGWIKTLIFHGGRAPRGERTNWVLHEYRLEDKNLAEKGVAQDSHVLCLIFQKDGIGPKSSKQYGAPFKEEDWTDDEVETDISHVNISETNLVHTNMLEPEPNLTHSYTPEPDIVQANMHDQVLVNTNITEPHLVYGNMPDPYVVYPNMPQSDFSYANMSEPYLALPSNHNSSITRTNSHESCVSDILPPSGNVLQSVCSNYETTDHVSPDEDILSMLNCFTEDGTFSMDHIDKNEKLETLIYSGDANPIAGVGKHDDTNKDLGGLSKDGYIFPNGAISGASSENEPYLELFDLDIEW